ncbi:hypothetical protein [Serratia aquatilis]|uniref:Uncharacterized protein n=1 Tax=Serratia aquatilis TaxID=1737515 RepID=A0ABV6EEK6_9GAMM
MSNEDTVQNFEERVDALAEEILMRYVMDGMAAKEEVKQLLIEFAENERSKTH